MRVAIFGVGQLARMMAQVAEPLGITCCFISHRGESTAPVDGLGDIVTFEDYPDPADLYSALGKPAVITVEKEAVPVAELRSMQAFCPVHPNPDAIEITQHRGREKQFLADHGIDTTRFAIVNEPESLQALAAPLQRPLFAKSMTSGYDGKHQWQIRTDQDLEELAGIFPEGGVILEEGVSFRREVSFLAVHNTAGDIRFYPGVENLHREGILVRSQAPAPNLSDALESTARDWLQRLMDAWDYVGVLTMECFETDKGLLVNELAPRVHNSGHWTMQPGIASQFENHIRGVAGLELGSTEATENFGMVNVLGAFDTEQHSQLLDDTGAEFHWYQKTPQPRRKLGHINCRHQSQAELEQHLDRILAALYKGNSVESVSE